MSNTENNMLIEKYRRDHDPAFDEGLLFDVEGLEEYIRNSLVIIMETMDDGTVPLVRTIYPVDKTTSLKNIIKDFVLWEDTYGLGRVLTRLEETEKYFAKMERRYPYIADINE